MTPTRDTAERSDSGDPHAGGRAVRAAGIEHTVTRHGRVRSPRGGRRRARHRAARPHQDPRRAAVGGRARLRPRARRPDVLVGQGARAARHEPHLDARRRPTRRRSRATSGARSRRSGRRRACRSSPTPTSCGRRISLGGGAHGVGLTVAGRRRHPRVRRDGRRHLRRGDPAHPLMGTRWPPSSATHRTVVDHLRK